MQKSQLDLQHFLPTWERVLDNLVSETEFDSLLGSDVNLLNAGLSQKRIGNTCALAQDVFSALVIRQGSGQ